MVSLAQSIQSFEPDETSKLETRVLCLGHSLTDLKETKSLILSSLLVSAAVTMEQDGASERPPDQQSHGSFRKEGREGVSNDSSALLPVTAVLLSPVGVRNAMH